MASATVDVEETTEILRERIMEARLPGGTHLYHRELAEDLNVPRAAVSEALRVLEREFLVEQRGRSGRMQVKQMGYDELLAAYAAREGVDGLVARLATKRAGRGLDHRLQEHLEEQREARAAGDALRFLRADIGFHTTLVIASGDHALAEQWARVRCSTRYVAAISAAQLAPIVSEHEKIFAFVWARRAAEAESAARDHVRSAIASIQAGLAWPCTVRPTRTLRHIAAASTAASDRDDAAARAGRTSSERSSRAN